MWSVIKTTLKMMSALREKRALQAFRIFPKTILITVNEREISLILSLGSFNQASLSSQIHLPQEVALTMHLIFLVIYFVNHLLILLITIVIGF